MWRRTRGFPFEGGLWSGTSRGRPAGWLQMVGLVAGTWPGIAGTSAGTGTAGSTGTAPGTAGCSPVR